jgi:RimK family alpha-L-glutamate ligase
MKIALITTLATLEENSRIQKEVEAMGHIFQLVDLKNFSFSIMNGKLAIDQVEKFSPDIAIFRAILNSVKPITVIVKGLRLNGVKVFDNNLSKHQYSIDKVSDLLKLQQADIPIPDTSYSRNFANYFDFANKIGYPVIIKSMRMGKGVGIYKVDSSKQLSNIIEKLDTEGESARNFILQEYVPYKYDLRCLVVGESTITMRRIPKEGDFRANFSLGGSVESFEIEDHDRELALKAMKAVDMQVGGVDILIGENRKRYILEVNHSAGFVGMEKATGENITRKYLEFAITNAK